MYTKEQRKLLFLSSLGGVLEFYDFVIYALLAQYLAKLFFTTGNKVTSLMATFATFSVGYLVRPLGGIIFGHFGDKFGRKKTFTVSIFLMAVSTFCIGLVPSYAQIGVAAPLILTILRICQGLSIGGELPGAIVYVSEAVPNRKNLACGIIFCAVLSGLVFGSLAQAILTSLLSPPQMLAWGWRIPFFIGGIFGIVSYRLRTQLEESPIFRSIEHDIEEFPFLKVLQQRWVNTIAATCIVACVAALISLLFLFMPSYISQVLKITSQKYIWFNTLALVIVCLLCIIVGNYTDHHNNRKILGVLSILIILSAWPIFMIYVKQFEFFYISLLLSALLTGWAWGVIPPMLTELYPTKIRYSGVAVSYNLGLAIFGGLTPLISTVLIYKTSLLEAPAFYLIFTALLCLLGLAISQHKHLESD